MAINTADIRRRLTGARGQPPHVVQLDRVKPMTDPILSKDEPGYLTPDAYVVCAILGENMFVIPVSLIEKCEIVHLYGNSVTYCPRTGAAATYPVALGNSGLLFNGNSVLYDYGDGSLLSQILGTYVRGPKDGAVVPRIPTIVARFRFVHSVSLPDVRVRDLHGFQGEFVYVHGEAGDSNAFRYETSEYARYYHSDDVPPGVFPPVPDTDNTPRKAWGRVDLREMKNFIVGIPDTIQAVTEIFQKENPLFVFYFAVNAFKHLLVKSKRPAYPGYVHATPLA